MKQPDNQEYTVTRMLLYCLEENYEKLEQELNFILLNLELKKIKNKRGRWFYLRSFYFSIFITNNFSVFVLFFVSVFVEFVPFQCPLVWK